MPYKPYRQQGRPMQQAAPAIQQAPAASTGAEVAARATTDNNFNSFDFM